jgi:hypothetical protein
MWGMVATDISGERGHRECEAAMIKGSDSDIDDE